ncbi:MULTISPECIES: hypothetical protein [unclassified Streptomyces]|uniref:hypothetical protein n=1 Tax=unclassified Streptomyces TaxID=2593676 RepID=UPI002366F111|nr:MULTISPECIES: hypothetical protein [unclassified Streptomyces]MDF3141214.1 hypothetical protein [Streptomyces sp. T21Q-yed]WDF40912.1 hypothetical protein PBV52_31110 [Streptomyces sp. T12]
MAWDEWEQLKAAVAERHAAQMQLNQLPADQGGSSTSGVYGPPSGKLRSDRAAWSKAGKDVGALRGNIGKALAKLEDGQKGLGDASGSLTAAAQRDVYDSWERYVKDVSRRCDALAGVFEKVGNDQMRTDEAVKAEIATLKVQFEDTPVVGGQAEGQ